MDSTYLSTAEIANRVEVSSSTVARYRAEFAAYLNPYAPPGGGRGLKAEAVDVFLVIKEMKERRASWFDVKGVLEERFGAEESADEPMGSKSFRHSLEAIRQTQLVMANELHVLLREVNRRLDQLEKTARQLHLIDKEEAKSRKHAVEREDLPRPESLFPGDDRSEETSI
jgi:hypothetical protein